MKGLKHEQLFRWDLKTYLMNVGFGKDHTTRIPTNRIRPPDTGGAGERGRGKGEPHEQGRLEIQKHL